MPDKNSDNGAGNDPHDTGQVPHSPRATGGIPPPTPPAVSEAYARFHRMEDQHLSYRVAADSASLMVSDEDVAGLPTITSNARAVLVQTALAVKVSINQYKLCINNLSDEDSSVLPPFMFSIHRQDFDAYIQSVDTEYKTLRNQLDALISLQKVQHASEEVINLPDSLVKGLEKLCTVSSDSSVGVSGTSTTSQDASAWALYYKKSFPKFNGSFDAYLEWSSLMTKSVLPLFKNLPELAVRMLKESVEGSPHAKALIASVDSTHDKPSDKIMALLEGYYGSKSTLGLFYSSELRKLKPVSEGDYKGLCDFILALDNIVSKLVKNSLECYVDPGEIFILQNCLPPSRREGWTDKYVTLTPKENAQPIGKFREYCLSILPAVQKMSIDRGLSVEMVKAHAKSRYVLAGQREDDSTHDAQSSCATFFCAFHESGNHDSNNCKRFLSLTPRDRSRLCSKFDICKVCLMAGHKSRDCSDKSPCKHCQLVGHNTLLCFKDDVNLNDSPREQRQMLGERDSKAPRSSSKKSAISPGRSGVFSSSSSMPSSECNESFSGLGSNDSLASSAPHIPYQMPPFYTPYPYVYPPYAHPHAVASPFFASNAYGSLNAYDAGGQVAGGRVGQGPDIGATPAVPSVNANANATQSSIRSNPTTDISHVNATVSQPSVRNIPTADVHKQTIVQPRLPSDGVIINTPARADARFTNTSLQHDVNRYGVSGAGSNIAETHVIHANVAQLSTPVAIDPVAPVRDSGPPAPQPADPQGPASLPPGEVVSYSSQTHTMGLYSIYSIPFVKPGASPKLSSTKDDMSTLRSRSAHPSCFNPDTHLVGFLDTGSDSSFLTRRCARRVGARLIDSKELHLTTLDGSKSERTEIVSFTILDIHGKAHEIIAYTRDFIARPACQIDLNTLNAIFPDYDNSSVQRPSGEVDLLLGADYFSLFPKREILCSGNLSIMAGDLGPTLQGQHPALTAYMISSPTGHCVRTVSIAHAEVSMMQVTDHTRNGQKSKARSFSNCVMYDDVPIPPLTYDNRADELADSPTISATHPQVDAKDGFSATNFAQEILIDKASETPQLVDIDINVPPLVDVLHDCLSENPLGKSKLSSKFAFAGKSPPPTPRNDTFLIHHYDNGSSGCQFSFNSIHTTSDSLITTSVHKSASSDFNSDLSIPRIDSFIEGEELGTKVNPECGGCKCGHCPIPGHSYSFREEQELRLIVEGLRYEPDRQIWITSYPWIVDPSKLPDNYSQALAVLRSTERVLASDPSWKETYTAQIYEHQERGVCRKLSPEEIASWNGPVFHIAHMALEQPKSESTPVRVVFNASQCFKGISLNSCLAKGPDRYNTSLLGMLIRWREFLVCLIGDLRKMYNSVHLEPLEQHVHRFLWRDCEDRPPDVYVMTRVSLGDKPSGTIAIVAKNLTAQRFAHIDPDAAKTLTTNAYVDDIIDSVMSWPLALSRSSNCEKIAGLGSFVFKGWDFGGHGVPIDLLKETLKRVLGVMYAAKTDSISFPPKLNFSEKRRKVPTGPDLTIEDIPSGIPTESLTKRICLSQVMSIYDPLGILAPVTLTAKQLLRNSWQACESWDDLLPFDLQLNWTDFFVSLFAVGQYEFRRSLTPPSAVGDPVLIICSDGSKDAYGCAAYVRYLTTSGVYHSTLAVAKSRIAPKVVRTIPQMELNGALLASRLKCQILTETRLNFSQIFMLTDSEIVLHQINSVASTFEVYTGVRVGEIQSDNEKFPSVWAWVPGTQNPADLATRPQPPGEISPSSVWFNGPSFFTLPSDEWPIRIDFGSSTTEDARSLSPSRFVHGFSPG